MQHHALVRPSRMFECSRRTSRTSRGWGGDISVAADMIASVEKRVYEHGFVILSTTSRRRIICMVQRKHADALCTAIHDAYDRPITTSRVSERKKTPLRTPTTTQAALTSKRGEGRHYLHTTSFPAKRM